MVMSQPLHHLTVGMLRSPATEALGQRGCGQTRFQTSAQLQRMDRTQPGRQGLVEPSPHRHRAKQRGKAGGMLPASPIGLSLSPQTRGPRFRTCGLQVIDDPGHDAAPNLTSQGTQSRRTCRPFLRRGLLLEALINQVRSMRQRARQLYYQRLQGSCQEDLGRRRMDHWGTPWEGNDGCCSLPPFHEKLSLARGCPVPGSKPRLPFNSRVLLDPLFAWE